LHVGGSSLARRQLGIVLALGCERIACLARGPDPDVMALQHAAERAGAQFHLIAEPRGLLGLVTARDELIVLAEGLLAVPDELLRLLGQGPAVVVQPAETGLAGGFERIDLNTASGGALRIPGALVERLGDLPVDFDALSTLQRIALQAGVPQRAIAAPMTEAGPRWQLVASEDEAHAVEVAWIAEQIGTVRGATPGRWLARGVARRFGPALLHARGGIRTATAAAWALALMGVGSGWFGLTAIGLGLCGLGWIVERTAGCLAEVERQTLLEAAPKLSRSELYDWIFDLSVIALLGWQASALQLEFPGERYFAPAVLIAMLRLVPRATGGRWTKWLEDRSLVAAGLAIAVVTGIAPLAVPALALVLALAGILAPRRQLG
jgi:hypothetical protein